MSRGSVTGLKRLSFINANDDVAFAVAAAWSHALLLACRGSDEREYKFLVKAGEDLRTDARMEQLFEVMNQALAADPACSERSLSLR